MRRFDPSRSVLAGMPTAILQAQLTSLQTIYLQLSSGQKGESFSYTQAEGSRSVTYSRANLGELTQAIKLLQAQLGIVERPRGGTPLRF